ncbi:hypothetical protein H310_03762 [Aphanomyces invadans]|uniref:GYF domain-containing protein n=1 Tax=Aphanomyces invadans TaxID=157072 RepID=A0A024UIR4_9STRA|nr:hypothetical protein H310_03762 [Aphanomyces invadans]ETW06189.1 hypothetical protein H310_03762 [Aphanomyces invadans]|eukprot:XP_008865966.1 hypothetical protein H310_03762 [Aphanomyces invadans]
MKRQHPSSNGKGKWTGNKKTKSVQFKSAKHDDDVGGSDDDDDDVKGVLDSDDDDDTKSNGDCDEVHHAQRHHKQQEGEEDDRPDMPQYAEEGVRMMAFNLKEDREDGHFDENGNFVWAKEDKPIQEDAWLENVSAQDMEGAERAYILRREAQKDEEESWTERRATSVFMEVLEEGETVLKALKRLGKKKKGSKGPDQTPDMKREFDELTEASDYLMRQGKADVYHTPKEQLVPQAPAKPPVLWEYKSQDGQIQGPYPTANFIAWQAQGYFRGDSAVQIRQYEPQKAVASESSATQDLEDDFNDDDDDEDGGWVSSNTIDFHMYSR